MAIVIGFLTFILALISLFLILLVLVQLPKKEAGVGMAFGAGMSEMLLGAGSGNVLTRITKYTVGAFLILSLLLSVLVSHNARAKGLSVSRAIEEKAKAIPAAPTSPVTPPPGSSLQPLTLTNVPAVSLVSTTVAVTPNPAPAPAPVVITPAATPAVTTPAVTTPAVTTPAVTTPTATTPAAKPAVTTPVATPAVKPTVTAPAVKPVTVPSVPVPAPAPVTATPPAKPAGN